MVPSIRDRFNSNFTDENYRKILNEIWQVTNGEIDFRICETPLFIDKELNSKLLEASRKIITYLQTDEFKKGSEDSIPNNLIVPNEDSHSIFLQLDFAVTQLEDGSFVPKLIELQGFPSLYAFQSFLDETNRRNFEIPEGYNSYFNNYNQGTYLDLLGKALLGNHNPENVILLEIEPDKQKTRIDFYLTKKYFGIEPVCITKIKTDGKNLYYEKGKKKIWIERIYNRVIFDELNSKKLNSGFDFMKEWNIEWAGHPNWFFKISKYTLPQIINEYVPKSFYLNELEDYPTDLENYVLKPLFSFAGSGVLVDVNSIELDKINDRENYILQEKVEYAPLIKTPDGFSRAEIRMMFLWLDKPELVNNLLRTSKGKMMGVDFNKGKTWVGSNIVYHP